MRLAPIVAAGLSKTDHATVSLSHILRAVRTHLGMDVGFISQFTEGRRVFRYVETGTGSECIQVGGSDPLEESYCHWVVNGKMPRLMCNPAEHELATSLTATKSLPVGAHLSIPILLRDGTVYGTFCCFSFRPDPSLTDRDLATIEAFAQLAGEQIQQTIDGDYAREAVLCRVKAVLETRDLEMVYQPAIRLDKPGIEFVEALARFVPKPYESPDKWFAAAAEVGLGVELEMLAVAKALKGFDTLPESAIISINVSPQTVLSKQFLRAFKTLPLDRIILEITEHEAVRHYQPLLEVLGPLRERGLQLAVDDAGAGHSSLQHILELQPEYIKLDMNLSRSIDVNAPRRALAAALVWFSREIGCKLVAEGVETAAELLTLRNLGVKIVQGHLMARPAPPSQINTGPQCLSEIVAESGSSDRDSRSNCRPLAEMPVPAARECSHEGESKACFQGKEIDMKQEFGFMPNKEALTEGYSPRLKAVRSSLCPGDPVICAAEVKAMIKDRRHRDEYFNDYLFADPAWDMLLELFQALLEQRRVATTNLCESAAVPHTTALRWITTLKQEGLIVCEGDRLDGRRKFVSLSAKGEKSMNDYFKGYASRRGY